MNKKISKFNRAKLLEISVVVRPICPRKENKQECEECDEKAKQETRKIMDDIWNRYPLAEVSKANFDNNNIVFEL